MPDNFTHFETDGPKSLCNKNVPDTRKEVVRERVTCPNCILAWEAQQKREIDTATLDEIERLLADSSSAPWCVMSERDATENGTDPFRNVCVLDGIGDSIGIYAKTPLNGDEWRRRDTANLIVALCNAGPQLLSAAREAIKEK